MMQITRAPSMISQSTNAQRPSGETWIASVVRMNVESVSYQTRPASGAPYAFLATRRRKWSGLNGARSNLRRRNSANPGGCRMKYVRRGVASMYALATSNCETVQPNLAASASTRKTDMAR